HFWTEYRFDAVLLDLNLPLSQDGARANGLDLLRQMREQGDATPVLILTARNRTDERIAGLDAGADDYLGKPFELAELAARLRALVRRSQGSIDRVHVGGLCFDRSQRRIFVHDNELLLPAREYDVLTELLSPPGRTVSKKDLADKLSDFADMLTDNALEAFISRLRKKILGSGASIRTLRGMGYRVEEESA
ncbi:MAG: DNA-binding response regulator, partial [Betaproteobacteria bacterium]|nr:DNA-binding response regulator [Betaproteobacteria bacterium]